MMKLPIKMNKLIHAFILGVFFYCLKQLKGGEQMVAVYVALIVNGRRTIDRVPARFKEAVLDDLTALGLDGKGEPIK